MKRFIKCDICKRNKIDTDDKMYCCDDCWDTFIEYLYTHATQNLRKNSLFYITDLMLIKNRRK